MHAAVHLQNQSGIMAALRPKNLPTPPNPAGVGLAPTSHARRSSSSTMAIVHAQPVQIARARHCGMGRSRPTMRKTRRYRQRPFLRLGTSGFRSGDGFGESLVVVTDAV